MPPRSFDALITRLRRAREHLDQLQVCVDRWMDPYPYKLGLHLDGDARWETAYIYEVKPDPPMLGVVAGEVVYQLHATLENLVWALVEAHNRQPPGEHNGFPVLLKAPADFALATASKLRGVAPEAADLIRGMQPYNLCKGGGDPRETIPAVLKSFADKDKHRQLAAVGVLADIDHDALKAMVSWEGNGVLEDFTPCIEPGAPLELHTEIARFRITPPDRSRHVQMQGEFPTRITFSDGTGVTPAFGLEGAEETVRGWIERFERFF